MVQKRRFRTVLDHCLVVVSAGAKIGVDVDGAHLR
jgi:hypothetical protein